ncbi:MAG: transketolase family protein [Dehalococcoidales bacterium]
MAKFNKYVQIGPATATGGAADAAMAKVFQKYPDAIAVLEDMGMPGIDWIKKNAPDRIVECGIAEANGAVIAGALASEGFMPFLHSFSFAVIERAYNQIRQSILVDRFNVKITARDGVWGDLGISHDIVEGLACTRILPNLVILNAADVVEAEKAYLAMADYIGPVYFRMEQSAPAPFKIFTDDYPFEIGKAYAIKDGKDATIIATGYLVTEAIKAIDILEKEGLDVGILNISTIKPLDEEAIIKVAEQTRAIVTAENGTVLGGLGEAVASVLAKSAPAALVQVGVEDEFSQSARLSAEVDELKDLFGLGARDIAISVKEAIAKREQFKLVRK